MGALKANKCARGHLMRDPNLYYMANGQRQCKKCKQLLAKEYRKANKETLKIKRKRKNRIAKGLSPEIPKRRTKAISTRIKRKAESVGAVQIEEGNL